MASPDTANLGETFDLLAHPHRRYLLYYLRNEHEAVEIGTVATAIAKWDGGSDGADRRDDSEAVEIGLRHTHLPKLAGAGIVTFDEKTGSIQLGETNECDLFIDEAARIDGYR